MLLTFPTKESLLRAIKEGDPTQKYLIVANYRALKDWNLIPLSELTVLLGPNSAGKSTIYDALDGLSMLLDGIRLNSSDKRVDLHYAAKRDEDAPPCIGFSTSYPVLIKDAVNRLCIDSSVDGLMRDIQMEVEENKFPVLSRLINDEDFRVHLNETTYTFLIEEITDEEIVDDYAHWLWLLQRRENCNIHRRERHLSNLTPAIMADMLGLNQKMQRWAPDFMVDLNESFSDEQMEQVKLVEDELIQAQLGHKQGLSLDELYDKYEELFWDLKILMDEQLQANLFGPDGKINPYWYSNEDQFWEWVEVLKIFLHFMRIFRSRKSEIRVHMERWYFTADIEAINLSSPDPVCMKYQNHAFSLLDRLAKYREDFGGDSTLVETGK